MSGGPQYSEGKSPYNQRQTRKPNPRRNPGESDRESSPTLLTCWPCSISGSCCSGANTEAPSDFDPLPCSENYHGRGGTENITDFPHMLRTLHWNGPRGRSHTT